MGENKFKRYDWVTFKGFRGVGFVKRVAKNGSWLDVKWKSGLATWTKRMKPDNLIIVTELDLGNGVSIIDLDRKKELAVTGDVSRWQ